MINALRSFLNNSGAWVSLSMVMSKVLAFLMAIFLVRILPADEFGILTVALNFIGFFIPALGFGSGHGMIRFGSLSADNQEIKTYSLKAGFINQVLISVAVIASGYLLNLDNFYIFQLILLMIIRLFGLFFLEQAKAELRADLNNKKFARIEIISNIIAVILGILFTLKWGALGYVISLCIFPFSVFLMHRFNFSKSNISSVFKKEFWDFSVKSVFTIIVFMWIFLIDVFFVGKYFTAQDVAFYKVSTLIPMNLIFIAQVYTQTMYPELCRNASDKKYLTVFTLNYYRFFIPVTVMITILGFIFADEIMMIFGKGYHNTEILKIMFLQMASCILMRIPLGNLMSAMGHISASLTIGIFILAVMIVSSFLFLPKGSPLTEAYISLISITLGGIAAAVYYFRKLSVLK